MAAMKDSMSMTRIISPKKRTGAHGGTANRQAVVHRQRYTVILGMLLAVQYATDLVSMLDAGATSSYLSTTF